MAKEHYMFIFLLQSIILQSMANIVPHKITCFFEYWEVHVLNHLPDNTNPLRLHCQSRDDDLGFHSISQQQDFNWHFCENFFHTTLFFCHLWWNSNMGPKNKAFDVFSPSLRSNCTSGVCSWAANMDGIYFTGESPPSNWHKAWDWENGNGLQ